MSWLAFALSYGGMALLAAAMAVHHRRVCGCEPDARRRRSFRLGGWTLVLAALPVAVAAEGWQVGVVVWAAMLTASGFALTLLLTYAPRAVLWPAAGLLLPALLAFAA